MKDELAEKIVEKLSDIDSSLTWIFLLALIVTTVLAIRGCTS